MNKLFVRENCHDCDKVYTYLKKNKITYERIYLDHEDEENPPFPIYAAPALVIDNNLIGYGIDIIAFFENNRDRLL